MFYLLNFVLFYFKSFCCRCLFIDSLLLFLTFLSLFFCSYVSNYIYYGICFVDGLFVCLSYFLSQSLICSYST